MCNDLSAGVKRLDTTTIRVTVVDQLEEIVGVVEHLDQMTIGEALVVLDVVICDCKDAVTNLEELRKMIRGVKLVDISP